MKTIQEGSGWGGAYSRFSFDATKRYHAILKEIGQPVLDDEFHNLQDMALTAHRLAVNETIGACSPNDGFKIVGTSANNNFTIKGGNGTTEGAGVFYVGGLRLILPSDITYSTQESPGPALTPPGAGSRTDTVYLDVWLDEVDGVADPTMIDPTLNVETSRRLKLMYMVRVAQGVPPPALVYTDGSGLIHYTASLATIVRTTSAQIDAGMVTDLRAKSSIGTRISDAVTAHDVDPNAHEDATETVRGLVRLATDAEAVAGTDATRAITPAKLFKALEDIFVSAGTIRMFAMSAIPSGWAACDGTAVGRTDPVYARVFGKIGTVWGAGNGTTTFNLPDLRGRSPLGAGTGSGLTARSLGATGGEEAHTLTGGETPLKAHTHTVGYENFQASIDNITKRSVMDSPGSSGDVTSSSASDPSATAHNTMHPFAVVVYAIKL